MNEIFKKRLVSFIWRLGGMIAVVVLEQVSEFALGLGLTPASTVVVGLIVGEVTKFINVNILQNK